MWHYVIRRHQLLSHEDIAHYMLTIMSLSFFFTKLSACKQKYNPAKLTTLYNGYHDCCYYPTYNVEYVELHTQQFYLVIIWYFKIIVIFCNINSWFLWYRCKQKKNIHVRWLSILHLFICKKNSPFLHGHSPATIAMIEIFFKPLL